MKIKLSSLVLSAAFFTGCASIVSDSAYPVAINSAPSGANFVITDGKGTEVHSGKTPATVNLRSGDGYFSSAGYTVVFSKLGYAEKSAHIKSSMDGWYIGNILIGGLIGMLIVDPITGAMWRLPESHTVTLDQETAADDDSRSRLKIVSIEDIAESDRAALIKIN